MIIQGENGRINITFTYAGSEIGIQYTPEDFETLFEIPWDEEEIPKWYYHPDNVDNGNSPFIFVKTGPLRNVKFFRLPVAEENALSNFSTVYQSMIDENKDTLNSNSLLSLIHQKAYLILTDAESRASYSPPAKPIDESMDGFVKIIFLIEAIRSGMITIDSVRLQTIKDKLKVLVDRFRSNNKLDEIIAEITEKLQ